MKKGLSVLCLFAMLLSLAAAMIVGASAEKPSTSPEDIAKYRTAVYTDTKPEIDGVKDAAYDKATPFYVNTAYRGTVWALWNEEGLYFYVEMRSLNSNGTGNVSNIGFWISGVQYAFDYDETSNCTWWKNEDGSQFRGNYRFQIGWTDANAPAPPYGLSGCYAPAELEKKTIKHVKEDGTEQGFDLEVFVPMKENDWDISKGAGQSYIGLGMAVQRNMWYRSGFATTTEIAEAKQTLLPSDLQPLRLIADPTTCEHEKTTWTINAPTLNAVGSETGTCPACGKALSQELPITSIQMLGAQTTKVADGKYNVRFVSQIATLEDFSAVGYEITLYYGKTKDAMTQGKTQIWKTGTVYTSIKAGTETETPKEAEGGKYLVAVPVSDIPVSEDVAFVKFDVTPFTVSLTGEMVYATKSGVSFVIESGTDVKTVPLGSDSTIPETYTDLKTGKTLNLVWHDEFNGSSLDSTKWNLADRMWDTKRVVTTTDSKNIRLENGEVVMNLYKEGDKYYSHKTLTTMNRMSFRYGYLEICAKIPFSQGSWPAFWLQSAKQHRTADYMTEVDVFEVYRSGRVEGALHKWELDANDSSTHHCWNNPVEYSFPQEKWDQLSDEYHRWGLGWTKEMIYLTVDGEVFATFDITENGDFCEGKGSGTLTGMGGFQDPLFINFTNWIGTSFRDTSWAPDENTVFPKTYHVEWIRLYQDETGSLYSDL